MIIHGVHNLRRRIPGQVPERTALLRATWVYPASVHAVEGWEGRSSPVLSSPVTGGQGKPTARIP